MENLTLISCSYNTPIVTSTMLKSFKYFHPLHEEILICDNSTNDETVILLDEMKIKYLKNPSGIHSPSVDILINNCQTRYALLVDTDIIFLNKHDGLFLQFKQFEATIMGEYGGDRGGKQLHARIHPWWCWIDVQVIKQRCIRFFDPNRMKMNDFNERKYDVGSSFFQDIQRSNLKIATCTFQNKFYKHYEGMSWRTNKYNPNGGNGNIDLNINDTHSNKVYHDAGKIIYDQYINENKKFIDMKYNIPNIEHFIIVHDTAIIDYLESVNVGRKLVNYRYFLVGNNHTLKKHTTKIVVANILKDNIENKKEYLQFTAWYALVMNNIATTLYVSMLEYDNGFNESFDNRLRWNIMFDEKDCYGFASLSKNDSFLSNDIFGSGLIAFMKDVYDIDYKEFLAKNTNNYPNWIVTSNTCMKASIIKEYIMSDFFKKLLKFLEGNKYAGHYLERSITVWLMMNGKSFIDVPEALKHYAIDSHNTQNRKVGWETLKGKIG